jgi:NAD(P)H-quinone oxidoreductase subunit 5
VVEIAFGLHTVAFAHMVGHALYRLLQFLSAPNVLHDLHELENATGGMVGPAGGRVFRRIPPRWQGPLFLFALERGFLDALLDQFVVGPFTWVVARLDRFDRAVCDLVAPRSGDDRND